MPSFTTVFRAIVMLATAIVVVKGWQLYGPSAQQMKSLAGRAMEMAHTTWNETQQSAGSNETLTADPQGAAPPLAPPMQPSLGSDIASAGNSNPNFAPPFNEPVAPAVFSQSGEGETKSVQPDQIQPDRVSAIASNDADRLPALLSRLEELGGVDPQLAEWGSSGRLYRFWCRATLADSPSFSRHFESVAAEPLAAVEKVVADVEAWRMAQRDEGSIR